MKISTTISISLEARDIKQKLQSKGIKLNEKIEQLIFETAKEHKVNYPPTAEPMGWASRVNAPTNVGNLP